MDKKSITCYLVRHGEAENNVLHILNSDPETDTYSLTQKGREQIVRVATHDLAGVSPDAIISSPIRRTRETAEIIAQEKSLAVEFDERLRETDFGVFNNGPMEGLFAKYPSPGRRVKTDGHDGVEDFESMRIRLRSFLHDIKEKYSGKTVIIVSHGDPLEQLHGLLVGENAAESANGWYPKKGSCTKVVWGGVLPCS